MQCFEISLVEVLYTTYFLQEDTFAFNINFQKTNLYIGPTIF